MFDHMATSPLGIMPFTKYTALNILIVTGIFAIGLLYFWLDARRRDYDKYASGNAKFFSDMKSYNKKFNTPFGNAKDTSGYDNVILAKDLYLSMDTKKTRKNLHQIVFGGSGTGKSYSLIKPNGLQMNASYIFTDPKGELLEELGRPLEENGYEIKVFNVSDMEKSLCYNPYAYIRDENGVRIMVNCIIENTRGEDAGKGGDAFWEDSMRALLQAISFYLIETTPLHQRNFTNVMKMLRLAEVDENNSNSKSPLDLIFDDYEKEHPESMAVKSYKTFRIGSGKTLKSILITCMTRLDVFNMESVAKLTCRDTLKLDEIGRKKQALFIIVPTADKTYNFLAATLYTQLFETLYYLVENVYPDCWYLQNEKDTFLVSKDKSEVEVKQKMLATAEIYKDPNTKRYVVQDATTQTEIESFLTEKSAKWFLDHAGGKVVHGRRTLPYDVRFMLDEFANIGKIPGFVEKISTMRSYKMWCTIILQNLKQLEEMYDKNAGTIIGNCDTFIFLGSQEKEMITYMQEMLGKTTKKQRSESVNNGKQAGSSSYQTTQANLMEFNEIREMGDNDCIVFIKGLKPFRSQKFNYRDHPMWKYTGDASDDYVYRVPYRTTMEEDAKNDRKIVDSERERRQKKDRDETVITNPVSLEKVLDKTCEGDPDKLSGRVTIDETKDKVAETEEEKELSKKQKEQAEREITDEEGSDIWEDFSSLLN